MNVHTEYCTQRIVNETGDRCTVRDRPSKADSDCIPQSLQSWTASDPILQTFALYTSASAATRLPQWLFGRLRSNADQQHARILDGTARVRGIEHRIVKGIMLVWFHEDHQRIARLKDLYVNCNS